MDAMQSITISFVVCCEESSFLQGQTTFQGLACWVLQHNPLPDVPFQVDDNRNIKLVLGHPQRCYNACPHHRREVMEAHILQRKQGGLGPV